MFRRLGLHTRAPYHVFLYSLIFGATTFHSFILSPIAFKLLKREDFGNLQNKIFPGYFIAQTISPVLLGLTAPYTVCPFGIGVLATSAVAGALNYFVLLPWCHSIKEERVKLQKELGADAEPTEELVNLNKKFGRAHALSSIANMVSIFTLAIYGTYLTRSLNKV
ncbi:hypothetical protein CAAN1_04S03180 [[Candida] anglica]|uniref:TMEM205-like domain-containing protein n=1 Tax=[Candida] anglica TaxID=148631 RepID=A0ABP0E8W7_9ASCO